MRRLITISFLLFIALCGWAKAGNASINDSICVIEGTVKNLPDGCDVILYGSAGKYSGKQKTITQIKKGKFHFEKKVKSNEKYEVFLYPCIESLTLYVSPGTKAIITGNGTHPSTWNVKSDNPLQKAWNALQKLERDSIPEYLSTQLRLNDIEAELYGNPKESKKENLQKEKDELIKKKDELSARYVEVMCNFIKGSTYSDVLESKLRNIAERTSFVEKKEKLWEEPFSNILREFLEKAPQECLQSPNIVYAKKLIGMPKDHFPTKPGSQSVKTLVAPANGNGWCTFYDAEKSYETDDLAEIYVIKRKETDGTYELTNKTENIIPAGVPVILHLGRSMEDGTNYSFLKEVNSNNTPDDFREWNFLDMTSVGEKVMGWRIGFSSDEDKVALYPWETDDAEAGVIYFRKLNSYIPGFSVTNTLSKWDVDNKKRIGSTQWFSRNLQQKPLTSKGEISYCINADFSNNAIKTYALRGTTVEIDSTDIERFPAFLMGDKLIVANAYGQRNYHVGLWKNNRLEKTELLFTVGDGPNDYIRLKFAKGNNNSLLAFDGEFFPPFSMTVIPDVKSIEDLKDTSRWKKYDLKDMKELFIQGSQYCSLSDSTILVSGTTKEYFGHILSIIDYKNHKCIPLDFWPDDGMEIDSLVKCRVYTGNSVVRGNGKGRYLFHIFDKNRYAFIFTIDGNKVNVVKELYTKYPKYTTRNNMDPIVEILPKRVTSAVNDKYVFILPIDSDKEGKKISTEEYYRSGQTLNGNTVEVYDWNGNLLRKLKLDNFGHSMMLSDDGNTLYLSNDDYWDELDPKIWSYDISNLDALPVVDDSEEFIASAPQSSHVIDIETPKKIKGVIEEGDMMADFELYDYDDKPHHLNEFLGKGKYTILEFSGLGCGPCQAAKPALEEFYKENKDKFEMITISTDREKVWKKKPLGEVSWHEWNDHAMAEDIMKKYHAVAIPTFIIINPDGKVEKKCRALFNFFEALKNYIPAEKLEEYMKKME